MKQTKNFYGFRYWPAWGVIGFFKLLFRLPYRLQLFLGKGLGAILFVFSRRLKHIAKVNIDLCFPELSEKERKKLLWENFLSAGIAIFETGLAWCGTDKQLRPLLHAHHFDCVDQAKVAGKGVLIFGAHSLCLEITGRLYAMDHDVTAVYRAHKNPFINFLIERAFKKCYKKIIERNNVIGFIRALKRGEIVCYAPDIDAGYYDHIFVPFFGVLAASLTASSRLAQMTGAKTLMSTSYRREDGSGYDIDFSPLSKDFPSDDIKKDITYVNQLLENAIRQKPEQYLWQYKRFKTRPEDRHGSRLY